MADELRLDDLLACPRCDRAPLYHGERRELCKGCKTEFPLVAGLPWMFAEPDAALGEWRNRLHFALQKLAHEASQLKAELIAEEYPELTRRRLELLANATDKHRQLLKHLLGPLDVQSLDASFESHLALRTRLPADQGLTTYYANVHRDWAWGGRENNVSLDEIRRVSGGEQAPAFGDVLVLGAGAGRLAYDLHQQCAPVRTVALDFNPLLLTVAAQVTRGEKLSLYEFPLAPKSLDDVAVLRTLEAPEPVREGFFLVAGDALRTPFAQHAFDTVVTPWLVDIVSEDFSVFARRVNRLLKPGGRWINFGSVAFSHPERRRCYSAEEMLVLTEAAGFDAPAVRQAEIPYMCSPASRNARQETVLTFCATKSEEAAAPARHKALPDWLVTGREPVPLLPAFRTQALTTQIYSYIMSLIDGRRSIEDMAKQLESQRLMSRAEALPAIRQFLTKMYDDSQRPAGF